MESMTREHNCGCSQSRSESEIAIGNITAARFPWLTGQTGNVIGSIARGRTKRNWGYVILRRNGRGECEIWELASGYRDWREAEQQLMLAIEATEEHQRRYALQRC